MQNRILNKLKWSISGRELIVGDDHGILFLKYISMVDIMLHLK